MNKPPGVRRKMVSVATAIAKLTRTIGYAMAWLCLAMVITTCIVVFQRYWLEAGSIRMQESITFMHALIFMLAAAYTLEAGGHVRVDIFYAHMTPAGKAWVNIIGTLVLLLPFSGFLLWSSWDYVAISWQIREASPEAGGLPYPFLPIMKSAIPMTAFMLTLQGIALMLDSLTALNTRARATT